MNLGRGGMAVDARRPGRALGRVLLPPVPHAREPPLAGRAGAGSTRPAPSSAKLGVDGGGVDEEIAEIQALARPGAPRGRATRCSSAKYRRPILLAVAIAMFNQLSGINALMYYAPQIFKMAGAGKDSALLQAVAVGGTNLALHDAGDDRHRPVRPAQADARRLGRLPHQPGDHGLGVLHLRDRVHADGQRRRPGGPAAVHRVARVRPGGGDLGLHQRDLPEPRPRRRARRWGARRTGSWPR